MIGDDDNENDDVFDVDDNGNEDEDEIMRNKNNNDPVDENDGHVD